LEKAEAQGAIPGFKLGVPTAGCSQLAVRTLDLLNLVYSLQRIAAQIACCGDSALNSRNISIDLPAQLQSITAAQTQHSTQSRTCSPSRHKMKIRTIAVVVASLLAGAGAASCGGGTGIWNTDQTVCCDVK
jgi:hypothetical protein